MKVPSFGILSKQLLPRILAERHSSHSCGVLTSLKRYLELLGFCVLRHVYDYVFDCKILLLIN